MADELAAANVNRAYQLAASSIAIFTFLLFFLYPRFASGEVDALPFQAALIVMGVATFSFAFSSFYYYGASLGSRIEDGERARDGKQPDREQDQAGRQEQQDAAEQPEAVAVARIAGAWFALWLVYVVFVIRNFPRVQTEGKR